MEQELFSLNEKGTNVSYGVVTQEIVEVLKQTGIANHLDIKKVYGSLGTGSGVYDGKYIQYIGVRTDEDCLTSDSVIFKYSREELTKQEIIDIFKNT